MMPSMKVTEQPQGLKDWNWPSSSVVTAAHASAVGDGAREALGDGFGDSEAAGDWEVAGDGVGAGDCMGSGDWDAAGVCDGAGDLGGEGSGDLDPDGEGEGDGDLEGEGLWDVLGESTTVELPPQILKLPELPSWRQREP